MIRAIYIINGKKTLVNIPTYDDYAGDIGGGGEFIPPNTDDPSTFWNNISQSWNDISATWNTI